VTVSWRLLEFSISGAGGQGIGIHPKMRSFNSAESFYYVDEGKEKYELLIFHENQFDARELRPVLKMAEKTARMLIILFHTHHFDAINHEFRNTLGIELSKLNASTWAAPTLKSLLKEIKTCASKPLRIEQIVPIATYEPLATVDLEAQIVALYEKDEWIQAVELFEQHLQQVHNTRFVTPIMHAVYTIALLKIDCYNIESLDSISISRIESDCTDEWKFTFYLQLIHCLMVIDTTVGKRKYVKQVELLLSKCSNLTISQSQFEELERVKKRYSTSDK
jgi:hypothetical protein